MFWTFKMNLKVVCWNRMIAKLAERTFLKLVFTRMIWDSIMHMKYIEMLRSDIACFTKYGNFGLSPVLNSSFGTLFSNVSSFPMLLSLEMCCETFFDVYGFLSAYWLALNLEKCLNHLTEAIPPVGFYSPLFSLFRLWKYEVLH